MNITLLKSAAYTDQDGTPHIRETNLRESFTKRMDDNAAEYREASNPEKPDFVAAAKIAHANEGICRAVGDNKAASTWNYLGEAPSVLAAEQVAGKFSTPL